MNELLAKVEEGVAVEEVFAFQQQYLLDTPIGADVVSEELGRTKYGMLS